MCPPKAGTIPIKVLRNTDLPTPLGPASNMMSPGTASNETSRCKMRLVLPWVYPVLRSWALSDIIGTKMGYLCEYMRVTKIENLLELQVVQNLAIKIWNDHYVSIIGQEQVDYMLGRFYLLDALAQQVASGDVFFLLKDEANALGFASIKKVEGDSWFVNKLYVETTEQRRGMGRFLLEELIETQSIKTMRLQVNRQNYKAINFYFKMGFVIERVADFDIGDGYFMNDFVMVWGK